MASKLSRGALQRTGKVVTHVTPSGERWVFICRTCRTEMEWLSDASARCFTLGFTPGQKYCPTREGDGVWVPAVLTVTARRALNLSALQCGDVVGRPDGTFPD